MSIFQKIADMEIGEVVEAPGLMKSLDADEKIVLIVEDQLLEGTVLELRYFNVHVVSLLMSLDGDDEPAWEVYSG